MFTCIAPMKCNAKLIGAGQANQLNIEGRSKTGRAFHLRYMEGGGGVGQYQLLHSNSRPMHFKLPYYFILLYHWISLFGAYDMSINFLKTTEVNIFLSTNLLISFNKTTCHYFIISRVNSPPFFWIVSYCLAVNMNVQTPKRSEYEYTKSQT